MLTTRTGSGKAVANYYAAEQTIAAYYGRSGSIIASSDAIRAKLGVAPDAETIATEQLDNLMRGRRVDGRKIPGRTERGANADGKHERVTFIDATWSAGKSVSVAIALSATRAERSALIHAHQAAVADGMQYLKEHLAWARRGRDGRLGSERAEWLAVTFDHFTARPKVKGAVPEPQCHTHVILPQVLVCGSGHVGSMELKRLRGLTKEAGSVYQASLARHLAQAGAEVRVGQHGSAELVAIPHHVAEAFSSRSAGAEDKARAKAEAAGLDWSKLSDKERWRRTHRVVFNSRKQKPEGGADVWEPHWRQTAAEKGYTHRSVFRHPKLADATPEQRHDAAYEKAAKLVADEFRHDAVLDIHKVRELTARAFVHTRGMSDPQRDIDAVVQRLADRGIRQNGQHTRVDFLGDRVTTALHASEEREAIDLAHKLHASGRLRAEVGSAGSGKTERLKTRIANWPGDVFAATLAWRAVGTFAEAGVDKDHRAALQPALNRIERGKWQLDHRSMLAVDEVALLGTRQFLQVLRVADRTGATLDLAGDPLQAKSPAAGHVYELMRRAGVSVPEHTRNYRQRAERDQQTAGLWREGRAAEALARMHEDANLMLAPDRATTLAAAASRWAPNGPLLLTPDNASARELGAAVRNLRRERGQIGRDVVTIPASDPNGRERYALPIAVGDKLRLFDQAFDGRTHLGDNGSVVEVTRVEAATDLIDKIDVRNVATGATGKLDLDTIRDADGRVRLTYGYGSTIHAQQGSTVESAVLVLANGSRSVDAHTGYTALSRHRGSVEIITNADAERTAVAQRRPIGERGPITDQDVRDAMARNLGRRQEPQLATDVARMVELGRHMAPPRQGQRQERHHRVGR